MRAYDIEPWPIDIDHQTFNKLRRAPHTVLLSEQQIIIRQYTKQVRYELILDNIQVWVADNKPNNMWRIKLSFKRIQSQENYVLMLSPFPK